MWLLANPTQYIKSRFEWEVEIEQDQAWQWMIGRMCVADGEGKILNGLLPIACDVDRINQPYGIEGVLLQNDLVLVVVDMENTALVRVHVSFGNMFMVTADMYLAVKPTEIYWTLGQQDCNVGFCWLACVRKRALRGRGLRTWR